MIIFNWIGAAMVVLGAIVGAAVAPMLGEKPSYFAAGIAMAAADLIYRSTRKDPFESTPFFHPKRGGNLFFIPVWIIGALLLIMGFAI